MTINQASLPMTSAIFALTYLGLAIGTVPPLRVDRCGIAVIGAVVMMVARLVTMKEAAAAIDYETIALLFGMMVLVAYLEIAGFFRLAANAILHRQPGPYQLLGLVMALAGVLSAFLVNDVVCVSLTPLILDVCRRSKRDAIPYLIGLAVASNVGSTATITGNPQNMIIGSLSGITYLRFAARLAPIAAIGLLVSFGVVALVYGRTLSAGRASSDVDSEEAQCSIDRPLLLKAFVVTAGLLILFFLGQPVALVALAAAAIMLAGRVEPEKIYRAIDWPLLLMFIGLFVVVHVFNVNVVSGWHIETWTWLSSHPVAYVSGLSVALSNLVSNVPAVLLFPPIVDVMPDKEQAWLVLAMSSTLAGNLTLLGSVANLIVVENARRAGIKVDFMEYLKVGIPVTILTTLIGMAWLALTAY